MTLLKMNQKQILAEFHRMLTTRSRDKGTGFFVWIKIIVTAYIISRNPLSKICTVILLNTIKGTEARRKMVLDISRPMSREGRTKAQQISSKQKYNLIHCQRKHDTLYFERITRNETERTLKASIRKANTSGSRQSMQSYILTLSTLSRELFTALGSL